MALWTRLSRALPQWRIGLSNPHPDITCLILCTPEGQPAFSQPYDDLEPATPDGRIAVLSDDAQYLIQCHLHEVRNRHIPYAGVVLKDTVEAAAETLISHFSDPPILLRRPGP